MSLVESIHGGFVHRRRVGVLSREIASRLPRAARVVDVGCGDGWISMLVARRRPDIAIEGIDVLVRGETHIPVRAFDGRHIPADDASVDTILFVDVLHHADDAPALLREAARVARRSILIKDHVADSALDRRILTFMDRVGNRRHGVSLPYNYWSRAEWNAAIDALPAVQDEWCQTLHLYPWWADWLFGGRLQFIATLNRKDAPA